MKVTNLLVALSLAAFAMTSAQAADDKKKVDAKEDKAATAQTKEKAKQPSGAAGATAKKEEKKESK
jgi:hypothetical protein